MSDKTRYSSADFFRDAKPMLQGVAQVASAVKKAYGPKGHAIKIRPETGKLRYTKRGFLIIDALTPDGRVEARGARMIKLAAGGASQHSGDGAATAAIISEAILHAGESLVAAGTDPFDLESGIALGVNAALRHLKRQAQRRLTPQQITCVATIAADNDSEIGETIGRMIVAGDEPGAIDIMGGPEPGVAVEHGHILMVGPGAGVDLPERMLRARTALRSLDLALDGGVVAGGGAALLHAADALRTLKGASRGETAGIDIVRRALQAPARQLALTAGGDPESIARAVMKRQDFGFGYDVVGHKLGDMYDAGIIDALKVVGGAVQQAGKIACAYVTVPGVLGAGARTVSNFRRRNRDFAGVFPEMFGQVTEPDVDVGQGDPYGDDADEDGGGGGGTPRLADDREPDPGEERGERPVRHLVGRFPERVAIGGFADLMVRVAMTAVAGQSAPIALNEIPAEGLILTISVIAPAFEVEAPATALLLVPAQGDSALVGFRLKAMKEGAAEIHVAAFHGGTKVGDLKLETVIVTGALDGSPASGTASRAVGRFLKRPGEASLLVSHHEPTDTYVFIWGDDQGWKAPVYTKKKFAALSAVVNEAAKNIEAIVRLDYSTDCEVAKRQLRARGIDLWEQLIPPEISDHFIARHEQITRISIYSDDDPFPWEMLYPFRKEPRFDGRRFLVEHVEICRWGHGRMPPAAIPVCRAAFVVADRAALAKADTEVATVTDLLKKWNAALQEKRIEEAQELFALFDQKTVSLLHFACHQSFDDDIGQIFVKNTPVAPTDFNADTVVEEAPFIFMNACRSDRKVPGYTKLGGWARSFLGAGAGAFIGTLWEVRDETAKVFAERLYEELFLADKPFGEALRAARLAVQKEAPGDPTWLAYSFYGDADARVKKL
jgi:chaperonin GroEL (HSP60 family)